MLLFGPVHFVQTPTEKPTLDLFQERFVLRTPTTLVRVPLIEHADLPPAVMYRRNDTYAVWDERGLTARNRDWSYTTRMPEIITSPKLFSRSEILENNQLVSEGRATHDASAISGSMRIGSKAYFLLRWDTRGGEPWVEALVAVDLSLPKPKPRLVGRYTGLSTSRDQIGSRLFILNSRLSVVTASGSDWGVASYEVGDEKFAFRKLGERLVELRQTSNLAAYFVEAKSGPGSVAGAIDLNTGLRRDIWSPSGRASFVDTQTPELLVSANPAQAFWADTTSPLETAGNTVFRRAGKYVIAWSPEVNPTKATAYDPAGWKVIATWTR